MSIWAYFVRTHRPSFWHLSERLAFWGGGAALLGILLWSLGASFLRSSSTSDTYAALHAKAPPGKLTFFARQTPPGVVLSLLQDASQPQRLWAGTGGGVFVSQD